MAVSFLLQIFDVATDVDVGFNIPFVAVVVVVSAASFSGVGLVDGPVGNADGIAFIMSFPSHALLICLCNIADAIVVHVGRSIAKMLLCLLLP